MFEFALELFKSVGVVLLAYGGVELIKRIVSKQ